MHRTMNVINGIGPQDGKFYDHPFFGQIFLGTILGLAGYPDSINPSLDETENLYLVPRVFMGFLAVIDTFLIYKIAQKRFDSKIALIAGLLFAVMPITWITRRILLDSILLPFTLLSILLALHSKDSKHRTWLIVFSGMFMGLAILTKIPAFTIIPVVVFLVYSQHENKKLVVLLLIPAVLLPMIWPAYSLVNDQFEYWKKGVLWQTQRQNPGLINTTLSFGAIDPAVFGLGIAGLAYAGIKRNWFLLVWIIPFIVFLSLIGFAQYFHWMIVLPVFCIAAAVLIANVGKNLQKNTKSIQLTIVLAVAIFSLVSHAMLLGLDVTSNQFEAASSAFEIAKKNNVVVLAGPHFSWIYNDVLEYDSYRDYSTVLFKKISEEFVLIADPHFHLDLYRGQELAHIYNSTKIMESYTSEKSNYDVYRYPYSSLGYNFDAGTIEVRTTRNTRD